MGSTYEYTVVRNTKPPGTKVVSGAVDMLAKMDIGSTFTAGEYVKGLNIKDAAKRARKLIVVCKRLQEAEKAKMVKRRKRAQPDKKFMDLPTIQYWQSQLRPSKYKNLKGGKSTRNLYLQHVWQFNQWLVTKKFTIDKLMAVAGGHYVKKREDVSFGSVEDMLEMMDAIGIQMKDFIKIIKTYLMDPIHKNKMAGSVKNVKFAIASYFIKNDQPIKINYDAKVNNSTEALPEKMMHMSDLVKMLTNGNASVIEKAVFLCKMHRGLDTSTLVDRFNYDAWDQMVQWFGTEKYEQWDLKKCPVPIKLTRIKTDYIHTGFLEHDAVVAIQIWLKRRREMSGKVMTSGDPLFVTKFLGPIKGQWVHHHFRRLASVSGVCRSTEVGNGRICYNMDSHELRDLLKSTMIDSGVRYDVTEHVIGHKPKDSYEKQTLLYPDAMRMEYAKVAKKINIFTRIESVIDGETDSDTIKADLEEKLAEQRRDIEARFAEKAIAEREVLMAARTDMRAETMERQLKDQQLQMKEMMRKIEELVENNKQLRSKTALTDI